MGIIKATIPKVPKVFVWPANQAEPNTSFHPVSQGLQHALRPHCTFNPPPLIGADLSHLLSPFGHYRRSIFVHCGLHASTFLRPFAPRALPRFYAPMDALTPARPVLRLTVQNERRPYDGQVSLVDMTLPSMHSVTKHLTCPITAFRCPPSVMGSQAQRLSLSQTRSGLRLESASSSLRTAESCSRYCYGLHVRLRLLPTPPRGDAVTVGYRERASPGRGLSPLRLRLLPGARIPDRVRNDKEKESLLFTKPS